jgi:hypothetical protein
VKWLSQSEWTRPGRNHALCEQIRGIANCSVQGKRGLEPLCSVAFLRCGSRKLCNVPFFTLGATPAFVRSVSVVRIGAIDVLWGRSYSRRSLAAPTPPAPPMVRRVGIYRSDSESGRMRRFAHSIANGDRGALSHDTSSAARPRTGRGPAGQRKRPLGSFRRWSDGDLHPGFRCVTLSGRATEHGA